MISLHRYLTVYNYMLYCICNSTYFTLQKNTGTTVVYFLHFYNLMSFFFTYKNHVSDLWDHKSSFHQSS